MTFNIIKGIKLDDKNKKIFIRSSKSNEYPKTFDRKEFKPKDKDYISKQLELFRSILSGESSLHICDNYHFKYAVLKFYEYCEDNNIDLEKLKKDCSSPINLFSLKEYYEVFKSFVDEKIKGKYYLYCDKGYIHKINDQRVFTTKIDDYVDEYLCNYKQAYIKLHKISSEAISKNNVGIKQHDIFVDMDTKNVKSYRHNYDWGAGFEL